MNTTLTNPAKARYDTGAEEYDAQRYHSAEGRLFNEMEISLLQSWLPLGSGAKVLDMPAGTGRLSHPLAETGATVVGVDVSANMLAMAARKTSDSGARRASFALGSGGQLPFADNTFDAVVSFKFFHLIQNEDKPQFVREMHRVLKPGGAMVIEFNSPYYGGVLAWLRYNFRKKHAGGMRMKCIFPDQIPVLFKGLEVTRTQGLKLPFASTLTSVVGRSTSDKINSWFGRLPGLKYLSYVVIVEARKPLRG